MQLTRREWKIRVKKFPFDDISFQLYPLKGIVEVRSALFSFAFRHFNKRDFFLLLLVLASLLMIKLDSFKRKWRFLHQEQRRLREETEKHTKNEMKGWLVGWIPFAWKNKYWGSLNLWTIYILCVIFLCGDLCAFVLSTAWWFYWAGFFFFCVA